MELAVALALAATGLTVSAESLTHDIGWTETGPGAGYFPFRIGLLLIAAALALAAEAFARPVPGAFVTREQLARTTTVLWPTAVLVAAMVPLGCYVPAAVYLAWMLRRLGAYGWPASAAFGMGAAVAFFLVFEIWFRVPLAKGPLEAALGLG